jgi:hypothetical protein
MDAPTMKKYFFGLMLLAGTHLNAQQFGLSFSYFLPKNGEFSTPISPFSIRGVGLEFNKFLSIETGASLYRMSGLNVSGLPFKSKSSIAGPNFTLFIPAELVFSLKGKSSSLNFKGGGFAYHGFFQKLNTGNLDRAIRTYENWKVVNSDFSFNVKPGIGWMTGVELSVDVTRQWGLSLEVNYLAGSSPFRLQGNYAGVDQSDVFQNKQIAYTKSKIDLTGLEVSLGIIMLGR